MLSPWRCGGGGALRMRSPALLAPAPRCCSQVRTITGEEPGLWHLITPQTEGPATEPGSDSKASKDRKAETWCGEENPTVPGRGPAKGESGTAFSAECFPAVRNPFKQRQEPLEDDAQKDRGPHAPWHQQWCRALIWTNSPGSLGASGALGSKHVKRVTS